jgi:ferredoxin
LRLRVDPVACDGYGHCGELAPELVNLDEWGYPIVSDRDIHAGSEALRSARLAVRGCPRQAMWLERTERNG